jgi:hypothetical protein
LVLSFARELARFAVAVRHVTGVWLRLDRDVLQVGWKVDYVKDESVNALAWFWEQRAMDSHSGEHEPLEENLDDAEDGFEAVACGLWDVSHEVTRIPAGQLTSSLQHLITPH